MNITTEKITAAARRLCEAPAPSGRECAAYAAARELLSPLGEVKRTPLGSLLCCVNEGREGAPRQLGWYRAILRPDIRGAFILPEKNHFKEAIKH